MTSLGATKENSHTIRNEWEALLEQQGARYPKNLFTRDEIEQSPLAWKCDRNQALNQASRLHHSQRTQIYRFAIRQHYWRGNLTEINQQLRTDLAGGLGQASLFIKSKNHPQHRGISVSTMEDFETLTKDIWLDAAPLTLHGNALTGDFPLQTMEFLSQKSIPLEQQLVSFGFDPMSLLFSQDIEEQKLEEIYKNLHQITGGFIAEKMLGTTMAIESHAYALRGANRSQEIAIVVATAIENLRNLEKAGTAPENAIQKIAIHLTSDSEIFLNLSKFRALYLLWELIQQELGVEMTLPKVHCEPDPRILTLYAPWVNHLRSMNSAIAGMFAGAESVTILPYNCLSSAMDPHAHRVARQAGIILEQESHLSWVQDPAGGSYFVESVTKKLAEQAWLLFQKIERSGGLKEYITTGALDKELKSSQNDRLLALEKRSIPITGTSQFPNLHDDEALANITADLLPTENYPLLLSEPNSTIPLRDGECFEYYRRKRLNYLQRGLPLPTIFLATLGPLSAHIHRLNFTQNFLAAAGIDALVGPEENDIDIAINAFRKSKLKCVFLCGSDEGYETHGEILAQKLRHARAEKIILAGKPKMFPKPEKLFDQWIFHGCNTRAIYQSIWSTLEAPL
ncbi:MAG: methylmalonyl-CoA mutase family protein [Myxococcota bacterium]|nr:methylmalonyl-CoA mutase family protein [Myxococcota bacterium]